MTGLHGTLSSGFVSSRMCSMARERVCAAPHLTPTFGGLVLIVAMGHRKDVRWKACND